MEHPIVTLTLQDLANLSLVVGGIVAVLSVLILFKELRENNKLTRAANTQALVELSAPFYMGIIQDRKLAELYVRGGKETGQMDEVDRYRYRSLVSWWLVFHENAYYQWRNGLLDAHSYKPWANDLDVFLRQQNVAVHWKEMKGLFQDEFAKYVTGRIDECQKAAAQGVPTAAPGAGSGLRLMKRVAAAADSEEGSRPAAGVG